MKKCIILFFVLLSLTGCASLKPISIGALPSVSLTQASNVSKDTKIRVILTELKDNTHSGGSVDLSTEARSKLRAILLDGGIDIVNANRDIRNKLETEFALIEAGGVSNYTPPQAANLAAGGEVSSATLTPQPHKETSYTDKEGKLHVTPAYCTYTAQVEGAMNFYGIDPVALKGAYNFSGREKFNDNGASHGRCPELPESLKQSLFSEALKDATDDVKHKIKNLLAARGHVVRARKDPKKGTHYFRISITPVDGAIPGVKVAFIEEQTVDGVKEYFPFGEGEIIKTDMEQISYVKVSDEEVIKRIQKGTRVRLKYSASNGLLDLFTAPAKLLGIK